MCVHAIGCSCYRVPARGSAGARKHVQKTFCVRVCMCGDCVSVWCVRIVHSCLYSCVRVCCDCGDATSPCMVGVLPLTTRIHMSVQNDIAL